MKTINIRYCFSFADKSQEVFDLRFDLQRLELLGNTPENLPSWTNLDFHQCPNCPLTPQTHPHCPLSTGLVNIVKRFDGILSYNEIHLEVTTAERSVSHNTTAQKGIGSLMGLVIATSGCPHTAFFRPMARFHLPLASKEETIYRATSMYLLAQYFLKREGHNADFDLKGLTNIYKNVQMINIATANRLRAATETDSSINAIIFLDIYAKSLPYVIEKSLEEIRYLFTPFFPHFSFPDSNHK
ncbi:MAG: hypothetical protein SV775_09515 [Thermodesulfobacteriota bacterium]|nr:hypothetical protein [Thermodesulfobacteriota bacterium]